MSEAKLKEEIWDQSKEWIDAIGEVIEKMADKLGIAAEHVYTVYTKQMFVEGVVDASISLLLMIAMVSLIIYGWKKVNQYGEDNTSDDYMEFVIMMVVVTAILSVITLVVAFTWFKTGVMMALNPEFYTLKYLIETAKEMAK
jgi:hypothetical protein